MNDTLSHTLAVKMPLSRLYLALFSAPLMLLTPADIARADDAIFDGDSRVTESFASAIINNQISGLITADVNIPGISE